MYVPRSFAVAVAAMGCLLAVGSPPADAATAVTLTPTADTYVASDTPGTSHGTGPLAWVDASPNRQALIQFDVSGLDGPFTNVMLRVHVADVTNAQSSRGGTFRLMSSSSWNEDTTWNTQPVIDGPTLGTLGAVSRNTWVQLDLTGKITGNGTYSIGVTTTSSDGAAYDTRESGAFAAQLVILPGQAAGEDPVLVGAGDIANSATNDTATGALLDSIPGTVFTAGDNAYNNGSPGDYASYYAPTWGRHLARTRPAPGNHDYNTAAAGGYFGYFDDRAGTPSQGYYSYTLGAWHVVSLDSEIDMSVGSPQETWLRSDLAANIAPCTLAYWHKPLFTSGSHAPALATRPLFQALYDSGAEVVVSGHNHQYERFAPMDPAGDLDTVTGIREFVAGMGGASHYGFGTPKPHSEVRDSTTYGVLKFTLHSASYDWQFVPVAGQSFTDSGTGICH